jgi:small subunit ribosomal protein S17
MSPEEEISKPAKIKKVRLKKSETAGTKIERKKKVRKTRDIGVDVPMPETTCDDLNCPFHGELPVRGQILKGQVVSDKMSKSVVIKMERLHFLPKYERYEKRTSKYRVHNPPCINAKVGDEVTFMECRPLSKTKHFVVISKNTR